MGRGLSALIVITLIIVALVVVVALVAPILGDQLFAFIDNIPKYVERLQALISEFEPGVADRRSSAVRSAIPASRSAD